MRSRVSSAARTTDAHDDRFALLLIADCDVREAVAAQEARLEQERSCRTTTAAAVGIVCAIQHGDVRATTRARACRVGTANGRRGILSRSATVDAVVEAVRHGAVQEDTRRTDRGRRLNRDRSIEPKRIIVIVVAGDLHLNGSGAAWHVTDQIRSNHRGPARIAGAALALDCRNVDRRRKVPSACSNCITSATRATIACTSRDSINLPCRLEAVTARSLNELVTVMNPPARGG